MANDLWRTPPEVFKCFDKQYNFQCDVAASDENHLCENYYTEKDDALTSDWESSFTKREYIKLFSGEYIWCNPPYSNPLPWVQKVIQESQENGIGTVMLLNHDMSTKWANVLLSVECKIIVFTGKRIAFLNGEGKPISGNNKGQVAFIIPPFVRAGKPQTEYIALSDIMKCGS